MKNQGIRSTRSVGDLSSEDEEFITDMQNEFNTLVQKFAPDTHAHCHATSFHGLVDRKDDSTKIKLTSRYYIGDHRISRAEFNALRSRISGQISTMSGSVSCTIGKIKKKQSGRRALKLELSVKRGHISLLPGTPAVLTHIDGKPTEAVAEGMSKYVDPR